MRISRIAAGLAATAAVAIGVAVIPAGAVTAAPTRATTIATNPGTLGLLLHGDGAGGSVTLGESGASSVTVGGTSLAGAPYYAAVQTMSMAFPTTKLSANSIALARTLVFRNGAHIVTVSNMKITVNATGTWGSIKGWITATGFPAPTAASTVFYLTGGHASITSKYGHTWTTVTGTISIPSGATGTAVVGALTAYLGLAGAIFPPGAPLATATAYILKS